MNEAKVSIKEFVICERLVVNLMMIYDFNRIIDRTSSNAEKYTLRKKLFGTEDVLPMWVADMDIPVAPFIVDALRTRVGHEIYGYEMMPDSAYHAQIDWFKRRQRMEFKREWMRFSPSVVATINVAVQACTEPGDGIIVQEPVYFPFFKSVTNNNRKVIFNSLTMDKEGVFCFNLENLKSQIDKKTKLLLLCSPHNPVGRVWKKEELHSLATICLENNIIVLADEIHSDLIFEPHIQTPFASLCDDVQNITITTIGPGKTFNLAGMSSSTVAIPNEELRSNFDNICRCNHLGEGNIFGHIAFEAAYREGDDWVDQLLEHLKSNAADLKRLCDKFPDKIRMNIPEGTYLAWLDCRRMKLDNKELSAFFINKARLGLGNGFLFGNSGEGFMRLNFAVSKTTMDKALARLEQALNNF